MIRRGSLPLSKRPRAIEGIIIDDKFVKDRMRTRFVACGR